MQRIISFLVANEIGVLSRVSGLLSKRGFNVGSITAGVTQDSTITRITLMIDSDERVVEQMVKQLAKLLDVKAIKELDVNASTVRELALVKINAKAHNKKELLDDITEHQGIVVSQGKSTVTIQFFGTYEYISNCIEHLKTYGIVEVARTGLVALNSGDEQI